MRISIRTTAIVAAGQLCALASLAPVAGQSGPSGPSRAAAPLPGLPAVADAPPCTAAAWPYGACIRDGGEAGQGRRVRVIAIGASADPRPR